MEISRLWPELQAHGPVGYAAAGLAAAAAVLFVAVLSAGRRSRRLGAELARLRAELEGLRNAPRDWECQIERFDVAWFPILTLLPAAREISRVTVGLPHCRSCGLPLSQAMDGGAWRCSACDFKSAADLAQVSVLDTVSQHALRMFRSRHPEYFPPAGPALRADRPD